jgi:hypothetical protein
MTTTMTPSTDRVPHGQLFNFEAGQTAYSRLNGDPLWHALALNIAGYADLQQRLAALRSWTGVADLGSLDDAIDEAVRVAASTGDMDRAFEPVQRLMYAQANVAASIVTRCTACRPRRNAG